MTYKITTILNGKDEKEALELLANEIDIKKDLNQVFSLKENNYNGWTNYETWRVNLEIFDGYDWNEDKGFESIVDFVYTLEELAENSISNYGEIKEGLALDYARAFLQDVNFYEIAKHIVEDYPQVLKANED